MSQNWERMLVQGEADEQERVIRALGAVVRGDGDTGLVTGLSAANALERLIEILRGHDGIALALVCHELHLIGEPAYGAFDALMKLIFSENSEVMRGALLALRTVSPRNTRVLRAMLSMLKSNNEVAWIENAILEELVIWGEDACEAAPYLRKIAKKELRPREYAYNSFYYYYGYDWEYPSHDEHMRQVIAIDALVAMGFFEEYMMPTLNNAFQSHKFQGRERVIRVWERIGPRALTSVDRMMEDYAYESVEYKVAAMRALRGMEVLCQSWVPTLLEGLYDLEDVVREEAAHQIELLRDERDDALFALRLILESRTYNDRVRAMAARVLGEFQANDGKTLGLLERMVSDASPRVRKQSARAMQAMGLASDDLIAAFFQQVHDPKEAIRLEAAKTLLQYDAHVSVAHRVVLDVLVAQEKRMAKSRKRKYHKGVEDSVHAVTQTMSVLIAELEGGRSGEVMGEDADFEPYETLRDTLREPAALPALYEQLLQIHGEKVFVGARTQEALDVCTTLQQLSTSQEERNRWHDAFEEALF